MNLFVRAMLIALKKINETIKNIRTNFYPLLQINNTAQLSNLGWSLVFNRYAQFDEGVSLGQQHVRPKVLRVKRRLESGCF